MAQDHWDLGYWKGIPVTMHWTVLLTCAWLFLFFWNVVLTLIASVAFVALLMAHEFGHVFILRRKKIPIAGITLNGIHGETTYNYANARDAALIAWGGVFAQMLILVATYGLLFLLSGIEIPSIVRYVLAPVTIVFTYVNIFLMVIALLPIGPFDGHDAWTAIPLIRSALRRRFRRKAAAKLTPEQQQELEAKSLTEAANLMDRLTKKSDKEDAK